MYTLTPRRGEFPLVLTSPSQTLEHPRIRRYVNEICEIIFLSTWSQFNPVHPRRTIADVSGVLRSAPVTLPPQHVEFFYTYMYLWNGLASPQSVRLVEAPSYDVSYVRNMTYTYFSRSVLLFTTFYDAACRVCIVHGKVIWRKSVKKCNQGWRRGDALIRYERRTNFLFSWR